MLWKKDQEPAVIKRAGGLLKEFQQFALKGNVIDLAVAVVVGNAFTAVVNSLVSGIITPSISLLGAVNVQGYSVVLRGPQTLANGSTTPAVVLAYGSFLQSVESFVIVVGAIFAIIKLFTTARDRLFEKEAAAAADGAPPPAPPTPEVAVLQEIRDLLKERQAHPEPHKSS